MSDEIFDQIEALILTLKAEGTDGFVRRTAGLKNMLAALEAESGGLLAETEAWRRAGARSAAHHHAFVTGESVRSAESALETAEALGSLPALASAVRAGKVSPQQAAPIAQAAAADPGAEQRLVGMAGLKPLHVLRQECDRIKAAASSEDAHARIRRSRFLRLSECGDGAHQLVYRSTPDEVATVLTAARAAAKPFFDQARREGRREPEDAYLADGLLALAKGEAKAAGTQMIVRADLPALYRGHPLEGEVCEIVGTGPIPVSVARSMAESGDVFLSALATKGEDVVSAVNIGRKPTRLQETALRWLQPTCTNEACGATWRLETDHREDWAKTKVTLLQLLDPLCHHDHKLKTYSGWSLVDGKGKRAFVAPDDPRHPNNTS